LNDDGNDSLPERGKKGAMVINQSAYIFFFAKP